MYIIRDPDNLNLRFYEGYDHNFLWNKVEALYLIIENPDKFRSLISDAGGNPDDIKDKYFETLRAHIHFSEFQQFEAFLALIIAVFQPLAHWLYLTSYTTKEIKEKAQALLDSNAVNFSNGLFTNMNEALDEAVYLGFRSDNPAVSEKWESNIDNLRWMLQRMAYKYLNYNEYNSYKHGLRIMTGSTYFSFRLNNAPESGLTFSSDDSIRYLEIEKLQDGSRQVREVFQHFNPLESLSHMDFMCTMLENIKNVRLARIKGEEHAGLKTLTNLEKDKLTALMKRTKWSLTV